MGLQGFIGFRVWGLRLGYPEGSGILIRVLTGLFSFCKVLGMELKPGE